MMGSRKVDKQAVTKLIERGRGVAEVEKYKEMVRAEAVKAKTTFSLTKPAKTSFADYKQMQDDLKKKAAEQQARQVGPFKFRYEDEIESEVLDTDSESSILFPIK